VIVPEHVQRAVDHESQQLLLRRDPELGGVCRRRVDGDIDVAEHRLRASEGERDHVGGAVTIQPAQVQLGDFRIVHERDGKFAILRPRLR